MGYTHYFEKKKDIPESQWKVLCEKVSQVFQMLPDLDYIDDDYKGFPIVICDGWGVQRITDAKELFAVRNGKRFIVFNGDASNNLEHDTFVLRQEGKQSDRERFCKTEIKPYDGFVVAVLILLHNLCPNCYVIKSDGKEDDWKPVLQWLNQSLKTDYEMPDTVIRHK